MGKGKKQSRRRHAGQRQPSNRNGDAWNEKSRHELIAELETIATAAIDAEQLDLSSAAQVLAGLVQIADCCDDGSPDSAAQAQHLIGFVHEHLPAVMGHVDGSQHDSAQLLEITRQASARWGDSLELFSDTDLLETLTGIDSAETAIDGNDSPAAESVENQIGLVLSVLTNSRKSNNSPQTDANSLPEPETNGSATKSPQKSEANRREMSTAIPAPPPHLTISPDLHSDVDLRDAFLDDANRCLADMESVVLDSSAYAGDAERVQIFCRQLHTLKGASASVGLGELAGYLHDLEEWLERSAEQQNRDLDDDLLLAAVDSVRKQISVLQNIGCGEPVPHAPNSTAAERTLDSRAGSQTANLGTSHLPGESSVRVRASQLDRLMDMLGELVVIRNHRETRVADLTQFNEELGRCANRLRRFNDERTEVVRTTRRRSDSSVTPTAVAMGSEPTSANAISEVATDITAISREIMESYKPLVEENLALSHFIRHFRQELMQLRRLPVAGLFQRLKRSVRDAARLEEKQVEIRIEGEDTGLEQSIQERLYEPLLHMVRNAVSHGIETPDARSAKGKPPQGTVTLRAAASASLLVITVTDNGRGLDFDALRRRGFERGLLRPGSVPSKQQLAKLIFHPGFSTRESASQVSGRGIGMDVVATTIDRMQGRIDVDSETGSGTTIRLSIPLTTGIEHVMVFRSAGRLFALPMRSITAANDSSNRSDSRQLVSFATSMGMVPNDSSRETSQQSGQSLMLDDQFGLRVDAVLGPEEVVVRSLPAAVEHHPLFNGVILSGSGETVLLLNADLTAQWCRRLVDGDVGKDASMVTPSHKRNGRPTTNVLVVDDSLSARKSLAKRLRNRGFDVVEAGDGLDAIGYLRSDSFDLVFTDLDMPRMGGLELLSEINQSELIDAPVIVVSSRAKEDVGKRVAENGAKAFLNKPVSEDSLTDVLGQLELVKH